MTNEKLIRKGIKCIREGRIKFLLFGVIYFIISLKNKWIQKLNYAFIKLKNIKKDYYKIVVNDSLMYIDLMDKGISEELCINKKRECFTTDFLKKVIKKDDIIIDIGANIGYYVLLEAKLASKGKIYAIEPIPKNNDLLKRNIKLNNYKNVFVFKCALGNKQGKGTMNICNKSNWSSFTKNPNVKIIKEINVPITTLDRFVEKNLHKPPTLVRMDVEGYEYQIIKGMLKTLNKNIPLKLLIELHPPWLNLMSRKNMEELIDILKSKGFKIKGIFSEVSPFNYKDIKIINKLRRMADLPEFGFMGESYEDLERLLKVEDIYVPNIFFERK